ncbi:MAG: hypothetical protein ACPLXC_00220 [Candidatus Pacearchaeota archaeon]
MYAKTLMFIAGIIALVVSAAGLAINLGYAFAFLEALPSNPMIYLAIDAIIGLLLVIFSFQRSLY